MSKTPYIILRIGLGLTFIWIADLIWKNPELWVGFIPIWLQDSLPISGILFMQITAIIDFFLGLLLVLNLLTPIVSALAAIHLFGLVLSLGFGDLSARDFGLFTAALAIFFQSRSKKKSPALAVPMQE